ncbi:Asparagine synthetase domain-containing protein 1 [Hypsibius exemplaris]|uniref:Asparagine synthetase domain-containing protein 1 n=1 Tax=Hypsibius exemplaris TaxID=2072580 RepID=A0A1W0X4J6_HYPEX|nr:Asparagine synthetase domain-containing protein 1 [Hypsibius exemplaris]
MCGIFFVAWPNSAQAPNFQTDTLAAIDRRGPDWQGFCCTCSCGSDGSVFGSQSVTGQRTIPSNEDAEITWGLECDCCTAENGEETSVAPGVGSTCPKTWKFRSAVEQQASVKKSHCSSSCLFGSGCRIPPPKCNLYKNNYDEFGDAKKSLLHVSMLKFRSEPAEPLTTPEVSAQSSTSDGLQPNSQPAVSPTLELEDRISFHLHASVLQLRGSELVRQPVRDPRTGNSLAWNGELFGTIAPSESDTLALFQQLNECDGDFEMIFQVMSRCHGPAAFVYHDHARDIFVFGRDRFGRRSLTWMTRPDGTVILSSVVPVDAIDGDAECFGEVSPHGLFKLEKSKGRLLFSYRPWVASDIRGKDAGDDEDLARFMRRNTVGIELWDAKDASVPVSVHVEQTADFAAPWTGQTPLTYLDDLLEDGTVQDLVERFSAVFRESVRVRCESAVAWCKHCSSACRHAKIAVLFSGGIDSMAVAMIANEYVPAGDPIDLINVAFTTDAKLETASSAPDRITALAGYHILRTKFLHRQWNMLTCDIPKSHVDAVRQSRLWKLIAPQSSVLDCSLATVLWFAARGAGTLPDGTAYTTPARVVLSGLGADELLGGYSRHRTKFQQDGWTAMEAEMTMDVWRIGSRNCGRDDRVIADHGREARYPFLDEKVVEFLLNLPVRLRCRMDLPRGLGDKILLRLYVRWMGLSAVAVLEKRAMQFGSRIAKIDQCKRGCDISPALAQNSSCRISPAFIMLKCFAFFLLLIQHNAHMNDEWGKDELSSSSSSSPAFQLPSLPSPIAEALTIAESSPGIKTDAVRVAPRLTPTPISEEGKSGVDVVDRPRSVMPIVAEADYVQPESIHFNNINAKEETRGICGELEAVKEEASQAGPEDVSEGSAVVFLHGEGIPDVGFLTQAAKLLRGFADRVHSAIGDIFYGSKEPCSVAFYLLLQVVFGMLTFPSRTSGARLYLLLLHVIAITLEYVRSNNLLQLSVTSVKGDAADCIYDDIWMIRKTAMAVAVAVLAYTCYKSKIVKKPQHLSLAPAVPAPADRRDGKVEEVKPCEEVATSVPDMIIDAIDRIRRSVTPLKLLEPDVDAKPREIMKRVEEVDEAESRNGEAQPEGIPIPRMRKTREVTPLLADGLKSGRVLRSSVNRESPARAPPLSQQTREVGFERRGGRSGSAQRETPERSSTPPMCLGDITNNHAKLPQERNARASDVSVEY